MCIYRIVLCLFFLRVVCGSAGDPVVTNETFGEGMPVSYFLCCGCRYDAASEPAVLEQEWSTSLKSVGFQNAYGCGNIQFTAGADGDAERKTSNRYLAGFDTKVGIGFYK